MVACVGPRKPGAGKPKLTAVTTEKRRAAVSAERTHCRAGERREIRSASQRRPQVVRQAPHVHPAAGVDLEASQARQRLIVQQTEGENLDRPRAPFGRLTASRFPVEGLATLLE